MLAPSSDACSRTITQDKQGCRVLALCCCIQGFPCFRSRCPCLLDFSQLSLPQKPDRGFLRGATRGVQRSFMSVPCLYVALSQLFGSSGLHSTVLWSQSYVYSIFSHIMWKAEYSLNKEADSGEVGGFFICQGDRHSAGLYIGIQGQPCSPLSPTRYSM